MADVKISALPDATSLDGTEQVPLVQPAGTTTKKITTGAIKTFAQTGLPVGSSSLKGIVQVDGTTITATAGVITAVGGGGGPSAGNPTATGSNTAVNGSATTYMRSDASPAIQLGSTTNFGLMKADGTTITVSGGVISSVGGGSSTPANPTATASNTAVNGTATTYMRSDAAPAIQLGSSSLFGLLKVDGTTITASAGVISAVGGGGASPANPTATAGSTAINGSAATFMRSDASPAVALGSASVFGLVKPDGTNITVTAGAINVSTNLQTWSGVAPGTGVATFLATPTSANLAAAITNETGTGALVFATSPTLVTPVLGTPASGNLSNTTVDGTNPVGYRNIPLNSQTAAYTLVAGDAGKYISITTGGVSVPASVFGGNGDVVTIFNNSSSAQTIGSGVGLTMRWSPNGGTGNRTLAAWGQCTVVYQSATSCVITGNALT